MKRFFAMMIGLVLVAGCGYTTQGMLDPSYKTVYVKPVGNKVNATEETKEGAGARTIPPQMENRFTAALRDRMVRDGNLKTTDKDTADLLLEVTIIDYVREGSLYDSDENINEQRLKIEYQYVLTNRAGEEVNKGTQLSDVHFAKTGSTARPEGAALTELLDDAARKVVADIVEAW